MKNMPSPGLRSAKLLGKGSAYGHYLSTSLYVAVCGIMSRLKHLFTCKVFKADSNFTNRDASVHFSKAVQAFAVTEVSLRSEEEEGDYKCFDKS
jgi:hypothetical protein